MKNTGRLLFFMAFICSLLFTSFTKPKKPKKPALSNTLVWLDWNTGYELAKKKNKIILVDAYTDWCYWCKVMDKKTYTDSSIIQKINKHFVPIKFNPELPTKYNIDEKSYSGEQLLNFLAKGPNPGYPTTFFWINPKSDSKIVNTPGFLEPVNFHQVLDNAIAQKMGSAE